MTELSPAAQAVFDAFCCEARSEPHHQREAVAAALRAAADQVVPHLEEPDWGACDNVHFDVELYRSHHRKRSKLLAIAAELEAHDWHF